MGTVHIRGEGGSIFELDVPLHETIEEKLRKGLVQRVNADGTAYTGAAGADSVPGLPTQRPANSAVKAEWVGWAVAQGASVEDAAALTKADLVERYGQVEPTAPPAGTDGDDPDAVADEFTAQD
jgi:hypothetical protein